MAVVTLAVAAGACSAGGGNNGSGGGSSTGTTTGSSTGTTTGGSGGAGGAGGIIIVPPGGSGSVDPNDTRDFEPRKKVCDSAGQNCTCLRLALLGTFESAANEKGTQLFVDWLNGNSGGTATVTMVQTKPTLDAAFLSQFDILLVANVSKWAFTQAEKDAVAAWVHDTAGGIITLTGFVSDGAEATADSQIISFAGMGYSTVRTAEGGQSQPVYYQGGSVDLKDCIAWGGTPPQGESCSNAIITTPVPFAQQTGQLSKLTNNVSYVGAFIGYGVTAPAEATVVATDPVSGANMAVAYEYQSTGRIFSWGDEWVIYSNQWAPATGCTPSNQQQDQYNKCWVPAAADGSTEGFFHSVTSLYQTKQFWYNAINWVAPPNECNFVIDDPEVIIIR